MKHIKNASGATRAPYGGRKHEDGLLGRCPGIGRQIAPGRLRGNAGIC